ncbi:MAG TPA: hypothetical protein VLE96_06515 [Chlamydiales bacterium]|nr:hypothetical protein [Chlamydiales bacterium]
MFKAIIKLSLLCSSFSASADADTNDWVDIAPITKNKYIDPKTDQEDLSVWTLFTKKLGDEIVRVRLPGEPKHKYLSSDELEVAANSGDSLYRVSILHGVSRESVEEQIKEVFLQPDIVLAEVNRVDENRWDVYYRKDGKWIGKTYFLKTNHLCVFYTENVVSHRQNQQDFVASFEIKIPQK